MRGDEQRQAGFIVMTTLEDVAPDDHPLRAIRTLVDAALAEMSPELEALYASGGRVSTPGESPLIVPAPSEASLLPQ